MSDEKTCQCPDINNDEWHLKDFNWDGKIFYFDYLYHILNVPLGFEKKLDALIADITTKGYTLKNPDIVLHLPGLFQGRILTEIGDPERYDANVEKFDDARILTRVHRGPRSGLKRSLAELNAFVEDRAHIPPGAVYYWHTTCAQCAVKLGGDRIVLLARV